MRKGTENYCNEKETESICKDNPVEFVDNCKRECVESSRDFDYTSVQEEPVAECPPTPEDLEEISSESDQEAGAAEAPPTEDRLSKQQIAVRHRNDTEEPKAQHSKACWRTKCSDGRCIIGVSDPKRIVTTERWHPLKGECVCCFCDLYPRSRSRYGKMADSNNYRLPGLKDRLRKKLVKTLKHKIGKLEKNIDKAKDDVDAGNSVEAPTDSSVSETNSNALLTSVPEENESESGESIAKLSTTSTNERKEQQNDGGKPTVKTPQNLQKRTKAVDVKGSSGLTTAHESKVDLMSAKGRRTPLGTGHNTLRTAFTRIQETTKREAISKMGGSGGNALGESKGALTFGPNGKEYISEKSEEGGDCDGWVEAKKHRKKISLSQHRSGAFTRNATVCANRPYSTVVMRAVVIGRSRAKPAVRHRIFSVDTQLSNLAAHRNTVSRKPNNGATERGVHCEQSATPVVTTPLPTEPMLSKNEKSAKVVPKVAIAVSTAHELRPSLHPIKKVSSGVIEPPMKGPLWSDVASHLSPEQRAIARSACVSSRSVDTVAKVGEEQKLTTVISLPHVKFDGWDVPIVEHVDGNGNVVESTAQWLKEFIEFGMLITDLRFVPNPRHPTLW